MISRDRLTWESHVFRVPDVYPPVGNPRAVRAVGSACSRNPLPVVTPCHRVVRSDGSIGQYVGGVCAKTVLLTLEAA